MSATSTHQLDIVALYGALDVVRRARRISWRDLATEVGLSPSTLTRLGSGTVPDSDALVSLLAWLGHDEALRPYVKARP